MFKKKYNLKQSDLGNAGQVSQVEKGKRQVTASILLYLNTQTDLDYKEIIFGDIAKFVENMFYHCFSSILFRDLETVDKRMNSLSDDDLISIQSKCLRLSKTFANFNIQRKMFWLLMKLKWILFTKKTTLTLLLVKKVITSLEVLEPVPSMNLAVIDFEEMFDILWLMLGDNLIKSFEVNVCGILIESDGNGIPSTFRQENIDPLINKWWYDNVSTEIIPNLIKKLKENPLFNIRFNLA